MDIIYNTEEMELIGEPEKPVREHVTTAKLKHAGDLYQP